MAIDLASSLFRSRLDKEFDDRTARFHTSVVEDLRIFEDDIDGTEAHDIMLHEQGIIPMDALKLILSALEEIRSEWHRGQVEISAKFEDIHEYIESRVIEKIGISAGGMIHTGRSRNDQVMVDVRLRIREEILEVSEKLLTLIDTIVKKAAQHIETVMMLYTHGQHAQVGTFAHYFVAYADALFRDFQRFADCYGRVNLNPLGSGPVGGTSINVDRLRTTELLGFNGLVENSIDATSGRDWAVEAAAASSILMSNLSRMAADLIEWSTAEFGYVELADEYSSSSSIMPQKKNPSTLELIRGKTGEVYGSLMQLLTMVKGVPSGYYQDLQETKPALWRCFDTVKTCLEVMTGIVSTLKVKEERMLKVTEESLTVAVDLAEKLVVEKGLSFREAYALVAALVKYTLQKSIRLRDLDPSDVDDISVNVLGRRVQVNEAFIEEGTDPMSSLLARRSAGGPQPREVGGMLLERERQLHTLRAVLDSRRSKIIVSRKLLSSTVEGYLV